MATEIAKKAKHKEEPATRTRALAPFGEFPFFLSRMRDEFDRMFERLSREWPSPWESNGWRWGMEVEDKEDAIIVKAEAPGFEAGDFNVQVTDGSLVLRAEKKIEKKDKEGKAHEYREQQCYESVTLPPGIDKNKVDAKYHNGVLTITLPKTAEGKGKRITVKSD